MSGPRQTRTAAVALGLALVVFAAFSQFKLPVVLPILLEDYGYDRVLAGGFMSIFAVFGILLSVPIGRAVARRGFLALVMVALPVMGLGPTLCLLAPQSEIGSASCRERVCQIVKYMVVAVALIIKHSTMNQ